MDLGERRALGGPIPQSRRPPTSTVPAMNLQNFKYVALAEATTFLLLLVSSVLKRTADFDAGVTILGPIHGILFIAYVVMVFSLRDPMRWSDKVTFWILVGAILPFGGYVVDWWLNRNPPPAEAARA